MDIYLDFSKTFHTVSHGVLLKTQTHEALGKWSVQRMGNWLPGCTQRIAVNISNWQHATSWFPHGLILRLTLFQIFICDLHDSIKCRLTEFPVILN